MNVIKVIFRHEWMLLLRNRLQLLIVSIFILTALYAVYYGNDEIAKQQGTIRYIRQQNAKEQADLVKGFDADTSNAAGRAAYENASYPSRVRFFLNYYPVNEPSAFARLSIGQRDIYPYYLQLNAQDLYLQLFKSELSNPKKLLAGNFDLAFVIVYLLPLLIIAFTYNLLSSEKELGTFALLKTLPVFVGNIIFYKLSFYFVLIASLTAVISITGFIWSGVGTYQYTGIVWWLLTALLYITCWFSLALLINSFNRNSAFNAMWMLALWLLILIIIPSILNLAITDEKQVNATQLTNFIRRKQGMGESEKEMKEVVNLFYTYYPEYKNSDTSKNDFLQFKAYSAFVSLLDLKAKPDVDSYFQRIWQRNELISDFHMISPAVNAQNIFNLISKTGLENSFDFRLSITDFHSQISRFCFTPLFADRFMTKETYKHIPQFIMKERYDTAPRILKGFVWLVLLSVLSLAIGNYKLGKI